MVTPPPNLEHVQIGIICPIPIERAAVEETLDEEYDGPVEPFPNDPNAYSLGRIGKYYVVIAGLPSGMTGTNSANDVAGNLMRTFTSVNVLLLVGIGGGVPSTTHDIRLGDVVVSQPTGTHGGVVYYNFGKAQEGGVFEPTGYLCPPPREVLNVLSRLQSKHLRDRTHLPEYIAEFQKKEKFSYVGVDSDLLFEAGSRHQGGVDCKSCDTTKIIHRNPRTAPFVPNVPGPHIHYGLIASADQLMKDSGLRDTLNRSYGGQILCFEMEAAGLMNSFPCLIIRGISDYSDSHKRADKAWHGCAAAMAAAYAKELILELPLENLVKVPLLSEAVENKAEHEAQACLAALFLTDPRDDRETLIQTKGSRVDRTCEWIKANELYKSWLQSHSQLLWLSGGPGKGKTMLSIFLAEELERSAEESQDSLFVQYFCDNKDAKRNTGLCIIRGLIWQLLKQCPKLFDHILPSLKDRKVTDLVKSFESLWRIFETMVRDPEVGITYCILDGLDECDEVSLEVLLKKFKALFSTKSNDSSASHFNLIVVGRDLPDFLPEILSSFPRIRLDPDAENEVNSDIRRFIEVKVDELSAYRQYPKQLHVHVKEVFQDRAKGTFLWVGIVANELRKYKATETESALNLFPPGLEGLYARMLLQIDVNRRETAVKILRWVVLAVRPLTLPELSTAIETTVRPSVSFSCDEVIRDQVRCCGYFLTIKGNTVGLIHQSAKDYLLRETLDSNPELEIFRVKKEAGNLEIARKCLDYLQNGALADGAVIPEEAYANISFPNGYFSEYPADTSDTSHSKAFPLLSYAALYWPEHTHSLARSEDIFDLSLPFYKKRSLAREAWLKTYWTAKEYGDPPDPFSLLHLASYFGIVPLAENLLFKKDRMSWLKLHIYVNKRDGYGQTPLTWAVDKGHDRVVRLLLEAKADVNAKTAYGETALHLAAWGGHEATVRLLLEAKADVNTKTSYGDTALHLAARARHEAVVQLLLRAKADVNVKSREGATALHWAARFGHEAMVRLLLEAKADVDVKYNEGETALYWAAITGHEAIVRLLLEAKADVDVKCKEGRTALHWAAIAGHEAVVRLLLEAKADVNAKNVNGLTALHLAAERGHGVVVQLLQSTINMLNPPHS